MTFDPFGCRQEAYLKFWESGFLTDARIVCKNGSVNAHSVLLAAASPAFWRVLFNSNRFHDEPFLVLLPDIDLRVVEHVLNFVYTGETDIPTGPEANRVLRDLSNILPEFSFHDSLCQSEDGRLIILGKRSDSMVSTEDEENVPDVEDDRRNKNTCTFCSKSFKYAKDLAKHSLVHTGETPHGCLVCKRYFRNRSNLYKHLRVSHNVEDVHNHVVDRAGKVKRQEIRRPQKYVGESSVPLKGSKKMCCGKIFAQKHMYLKHVFHEHPGQNVGSHLCSVCGKAFFMQEQLKRHEAIHTIRDRPLKCTYCPKSYFRKDVLSVHEKLHTDPVSCGQCGKKFASDKLLQSHTLHVHQERQFNCSSCDRTFVRQSRLDEHLLTHITSSNSTGIRSDPAAAEGGHVLSCHLCGRGFNQGSVLHRHLSTVHGDRDGHVSPLICQHCGPQETTSGLTSIYSLRRHLSKHKCPLVSGGEEDCEVCKVDLETYLKLIRHLRNFNEKRVHQCEECSKKFASPSDLTAHRVVHTGEKPYACHLCSYRFTQQSSLTQHMIRHDKGHVADDYPCHICDKSLKTLAAFKIHSKTHLQGQTEEQEQDFDTDVFSNEDYRIEIVDSTVP